MVSSWAPLSLSQSLPLFSRYHLPLAVPYTPLCYILILCALSPFVPNLHSLFFECFNVQSVGSWVLLSKKLFHFLSIVAPIRGPPPPPIFKSPVGNSAVQMPLTLCPLLLRPQRASADRLVGDKSSSVTLVAGVMFSGWQCASPSNRCQHCHCAPSQKPNITNRAQQGGGGKEKMGQI